MKRFFKIFSYTTGGLVLLIIIFLFYFTSTYPKVDPPADIKIEVTPARLTRGEYLAKHVTVCMDCHSTRDWSRLSGPPAAGTLGKGGDKFGEEIGFPGTLYAKNITPAAIGNWTDGELIRLITCGVNKDGKAIFPLMPYYSYNQLTEEDLYSIVAYIRSLQPIKNNVPDGSLDFPLNLIVRTMPKQNYKPVAEPNKNNPAEYGKYLVNISGCFDCHTPSVKGEYIQGKEFAGGAEFKFPGGTVRSANITPEPISGIGSWTKERFIARFKMMNPDSTQIPQVGMKDFNSAMPWTMYAGMTREDLGAIYEHLKTLKPIKNAVVKWIPNN